MRFHGFDTDNWLARFFELTIEISAYILFNSWLKVGVGQRWHHHVAIVVSSAYILPTSSLFSERLAVKICDVNHVNHQQFGRVCDAMIHLDLAVDDQREVCFCWTRRPAIAQWNPWRFFTWIRDDQRDADNASGDSTNCRELIVIVSLPISRALYNLCLSTTTTWAFIHKQTGEENLLFDQRGAASSNSVRQSRTLETPT